MNRERSEECFRQEGEVPRIQQWLRGVGCATPMLMMMVVLSRWRICLIYSSWSRTGIRSKTSLEPYINNNNTGQGYTSSSGAQRTSTVIE